MKSPPETLQKPKKTCETCGKSRFLFHFRKLLSLSYIQSLNPNVKKRIGRMVNACSFCRKKELLARPKRFIEAAVLLGNINELEGRIAVASKKAQQIQAARLREGKRRALFDKALAKLIHRMQGRAALNIRNNRAHWEDLTTRLQALKYALRLGRARYPKKPSPFTTLTDSTYMTQTYILNFLQEWEQGKV